MRQARIWTALLAVALAAGAFAADVTGKWSGKIEVDASSEVKAKIKSQGGMQSPTITIEFKSDKSYRANQSGMPGGKAMVSEGKWSASGSTVTLTPTKRDGKAVSGEAAKPKVYTLSKDGKTMTMDISGMVRAQVKGNDKAKAAMPVDMKLKVVLHKG